MDDSIDSAAKALVALLMAGCDAALSTLAAAGGRAQPVGQLLLQPVRSLEPSTSRDAERR
ncbi:hypothetical protein [Aquipseudomonas alcaligenes]|nr:hypothetical protein [Pseudomonas alcaligenes]